MNKQLIRLRVMGRVQGVWFRQSTKQFALQHGITGYAKNLSDGSVEVLAIGISADLAALKDYVQHGPEQARVDSVQVQLTIESPTPADVSGVSQTDFDTL